MDDNIMRVLRYSLGWHFNALLLWPLFPSTAREQRVVLQAWEDS